MAWLGLSSNSNCQSGKNHGAVSPATGANASMQPVMMPGEAVLTVMEIPTASWARPAREPLRARLAHHQQHLRWYG